MDFVAYNIPPWVYFSLVTLFTFVIPLSVIVVCYTKIVINLRNTAKEIRSKFASRSMKARRKTTKIVVISILLFAICWLPRHTVTMIIAVFGRGVSNDTLNKWRYDVLNWCSILIFLNSAINPFLYPFAGTGFTNYLPHFLVPSAHRSKRKSSTRSSFRNQENLNELSHVDSTKIINNYANADVSHQHSLSVM